MNFLSVSEHLARQEQRLKQQIEAAIAAANPVFRPPLQPPDVGDMDPATAAAEMQAYRAQRAQREIGELAYQRLLVKYDGDQSRVVRALLSGEVPSDIAAPVFGILNLGALGNNLGQFKQPAGYASGGAVGAPPPVYGAMPTPQRANPLAMMYRDYAMKAQQRGCRPSLPKSS